MFLLNPWFIAGGLMLVVGLLEEIGKGGEKPVTVIPKAKKPKVVAPPVTVNVHGAEVQSQGKPKQKAKPSVEVPPEPLGDG